MKSDKGGKAAERTPARPLGWEAVAFAAAVLAIVFVGGMATAHYGLAPYRLLNNAKAALNAELKMEADTYPANIEWADRPGQPVVRRVSNAAGGEPLLMIGNFYSRLDLCPNYGCLAWVMDRNGKALHVWPAPDPEVFFKDVSGFTGRVKPNNFYVIGLDYDHDDGAIVVTFHGRNMFPYQVGIAKFDKDGRLLWRHFDYSHHWPKVGPDNVIYTPFVRIGKPGSLAGTGTRIECDFGKVYMEGVRIISPDGKVLKEFGISNAIAKADYPGLAYAVRDGCDPFHVNGVDLITAAAAARLNVLQGEMPRIDAGDLLVSVREQSALMVLDKDDGALKRVITGRSSAQHSPHVMPDGRILVFDNLGGKERRGGSRALIIDPATRLSTQVFPTAATKVVPSLDSETSGAVMPSPDGSRVLVSESKKGRMFEVETATGKVLWTYDNLMDFSPYLEAHDLEREEGTFGRLPTNGAFYLADQGFLRRLTTKAVVARGGR